MAERSPAITVVAVPIQVYDLTGSAARYLRPPLEDALDVVNHLIDDLGDPEPAGEPRVSRRNERPAPRTRDLELDVPEFMPRG